jgi:hypothetical protein
MAFAQVYVDGYTRRDGTYVQGHYRSSPNHTVQDNYSHRGNTNPYTGQTGTSYDRQSPSSEYYNGGGRLDVVCYQQCMNSCLPSSNLGGRDCYQNCKVNCNN